MKNKYAAVILILTVLVSLGVPVITIFAQVDTNISQVNTNITAGDEEIRNQLEKYSWLKIFIVPLVTVLVMGIKKAITAVPGAVWPWVTPFIGAGLDYIGAKLGFWTGSVEAGAAAGALAVWFHQLNTQTKDALTSSSR